VFSSDVFRLVCSGGVDKKELLLKINLKQLGYISLLFISFIFIKKKKKKLHPDLYVLIWKFNSLEESRVKNYVLFALIGAYSCQYSQPCTVINYLEILSEIIIRVYYQVSIIYG